MIAGSIKGLASLVAKLRAKVAKATEDASMAAVVGYTASSKDGYNYALAIHENPEIWPPGMRLAGKPRSGGTVKSGKRKGEPKHGYYWDPQGQAGPKFLERPAREMSNDGTLKRTVLEVMSRGGTLTQALLIAAQQIQAASMELVPVDTGNLKASAFTSLEPA